jgi:hypothetical protein
MSRIMHENIPATAILKISFIINSYQISKYKLQNKLLTLKAYNILLTIIKGYQ